MHIVEPYARMMDVTSREEGVALLRKIEWIGRISHRSEEAQTTDSWERFVRAIVLGHGDWSIVEHVNVTVDAVVDRGITHEWVRHRLAAYTQESTRFVNYAKQHTTAEEYVNPAKFICPPAILKRKDTPYHHTYERWVRGRAADEYEYCAHIADGIQPQEARTCFPNALAARLIATYNLRMWRHFFLLRTTKEAHPQMRQVTIPLLEAFQRVLPILFEDIAPLAKQADNLRKMR